MKRLMMVILAGATSLALGCGGVQAESNAPEDASNSSQSLSTCTALCAQGIVSCPATTTTCTATNYQGVICDGTTIACPSTEPWECPYGPEGSCAVTAQDICAQAETIECCWDSTTLGQCLCPRKGVRPRCTPL